MVVQGLTRSRFLSTFGSGGSTVVVDAPVPLVRPAAPTVVIPPRTGARRLPLTSSAETVVRRHVHRLPRSYVVGKRVLDIVAAVVLGMLLLPLVVLVAVAIRLDSPGPALYRQVRLGAYGRPFQVVKLRSMRADAERAGEARWASEDDPRVTRVGRLLRCTRLDEVPQLWNVVRGEMSLVGPRPERPEFVEHLEQAHPGFHLRLMVRPGLTGWAQVCHRYTSSVQEARVKLEYDLYYLTHASARLDLLVLVRTFGVVFGMSGR